MLFWFVAFIKMGMTDGLKAIYTPDTELKTRIEDSMTYEQDRTATKGASGNTGGEVEDSTV